MNVQTGKHIGQSIIAVMHNSLAENNKKFCSELLPPWLWLLEMKL